VTPLLSQTPQSARKRVLAWRGDTTTAYQHDSISHALAARLRVLRAGVGAGCLVMSCESVRSRCKAPDSRPRRSSLLRHGRQSEPAPEEDLSAGAYLKHRNAVISATFSRNGRQAVTASTDTPVWEAIPRHSAETGGCDGLSRPYGAGVDADTGNPPGHPCDTGELSIRRLFRRTGGGW